MSDPLVPAAWDRSHLARLAGSYEPEVRIGICRASVTHALSASHGLGRLIDEGRAAWAVEVKCPKTLMARVDTSREAHQEVAWNAGDVEGDVRITPGVVALRGLVLRGLAPAVRETGPVWEDAAVSAPPGWWLARGAVRRAKPLTSSFLEYRLAAGLKRGRMAIAPPGSNGRSRFVVKLAPDLFRRIESDQALQTAALVGVCGQFPRVFDRGGRDEHPLARRVRERLARTDPRIRIWNDDGYDPARVATALEPIRLPDDGPAHVSDRLLAGAAGPFGEWQSGIIFKPKRRGKREHADSRVRVLIRRRQEELLDSVAGGAHGLGIYLRSKLGLAPGADIGSPPFPQRALMPGDLREPSIDLERELAAAWREHVRPRLAAQPLFWLLCHIGWIEQGCFGVGGSRLAQAFTAGHRDKTREGRTRNFLRRTGGLPVVRGNVSVFSDCPLARAWWRCRLAEEVERTTRRRIARSVAHEVFHSNRTAWEELVMASLRRATAINQPRARAAIVWQLNERLRSRGRITSRDVAAIAGSFARQSSQRSLEHVPWEELRAPGAV